MSKDWKAVCDRCGFKFKSSELRETWDGLRVCNKDWEKRHDLDFLKGRREDVSVPWSRPEGADAGGTDVEGNTFPPTWTYTPDPPPDGTNHGELIAHLAIDNQGSRLLLDNNPDKYVLLWR